MASELRVDTIKTADGSTASIGTSFVANGSAKVFVLGASDKASVLASFNCSHLSDDGTGKQSIGITSAFVNTNYAPATSASAGGDKTHTHVRTTASACQFVSRDASSASLEDMEVSASIHGDLA